MQNVIHAEIEKLIQIHTELKGTQIARMAKIILKKNRVGGLKFLNFRTKLMF